MLGLNYSRLATIPQDWETVGNITALGTTLAVGGRAWSDVSSYFSGTQTTYLGYNVPNTINALELRFQTTADADSHVVEMWGARGCDHMTLLATLTLTGGTQEGDNSLYFVDTITVANENLFQNGELMDCAAANRIARYGVDIMGYSKLLFLATTWEAATNLRVEATGW